MKICNSCKIKKELIEFNKHQKMKDGYKNQCKICLNNYEKIRYENNKDKILKYQKEYYLENKSNIIKRVGLYVKNKKCTDTLFKLKYNISCLINVSIKSKCFTKKSKTYKILGCSFEDFKIYIENQFTKGMNWENRKEWHLDHIYPVSLAKNEKELIRLNHYTNFQPLWAKDNLQKSNKIIDNKQLKLL